MWVGSTEVRVSNTSHVTELLLQIPPYFPIVVLLVFSFLSQVLLKVWCLSLSPHLLYVCEQYIWLVYVFLFAFWGRYRLTGSRMVEHLLWHFLSTCFKEGTRPPCGCQIFPNAKSSRLVGPTPAYISAGHPVWGVRPVRISGPHWKRKSGLGPHTKYTDTNENWWEEKKLLSKFRILCWAVFIAILGHLWPVGRRSRTNANTAMSTAHPKPRT